MPAHGDVVAASRSQTMFGTLLRYAKIRNKKLARVMHPRAPSHDKAHLLTRSWRHRCLNRARGARLGVVVAYCADCAQRELQYKWSLKYSSHCLFPLGVQAFTTAVRHGKLLQEVTSLERVNAVDVSLTLLKLSRPQGDIYSTKSRGLVSTQPSQVLPVLKIGQNYLANTCFCNLNVDLFTPLSASPVLVRLLQHMSN